jgi:c-di-GMP-binding flagellar brake protein YcgR
MFHERRESPRIDILGRLAGEVSVLAPVIVHDISATGVLVECGFPLILGSGHDLRLHLGDDAVVVKARVVRCHIADIGRELVRYVAGLEFVNLPPHVGVAIARYIEHLRRQRESDPGGPAGSTSP